MQRFERAMRRQPKNVVYQDYQLKDDFTLWLQGYREKIRSGYGFTSGQDTEVNDEVVRAISGKLKPGTPLDTYNRLPAAITANYARLVERLTQEFLDPGEKRKFLRNFSFDKRKKGQSIQEFMQQIVNHQNRYSGMPDKITVGNSSVDNNAKVKDGIRRFLTGMRDKRGKKNKDLARVLNYGLMEDDDLTWKNAVDIATRWENSHDDDSTSDSGTDSSNSSGEEEAAEAGDSGKGAKKKKDKRKSVLGSVDIAAVGKEVSAGVATLSDKVEANTRDIKGIKSQQERSDANIVSWKAETSTTLNRILRAVEGGQQQYQPYRQPFQSQYRFQPRNPQQQFQQQRPFQPRSFPSWKARAGQTQQTGFRYNNATPTSYPRYQAPAPTAPAATPPSATATAPAAATKIAALATPSNEEGPAQMLYDQQKAHELFEMHQQEQMMYEQQQQQQYEQQQFQQQMQGNQQSAVAAMMGQYYDVGNQGAQGGPEGQEDDIIGAFKDWNFS